MISNTTLFLAQLVIGNSNNYDLFKQDEVAIDDKESISKTLKWIAHDPTHCVLMDMLLMGITTIQKIMMAY